MAAVTALYSEQVISLSPQWDPGRFLPAQVTKAVTYTEYRRFDIVINRW